MSFDGFGRSQYSGKGPLNHQTPTTSSNSPGLPMHSMFIGINKFDDKIMGI